MLVCYSVGRLYYNSPHTGSQGDALTLFDKPPHYRTYLLTIWEERSQAPKAPKVWRFSLEDPLTGQRHGYADLEALVDALEREIAGLKANEKKEEE